MVQTTQPAVNTRRPATVRAVLPGADALGFEVATLLLGVVTDAFVLGSQWLLPAVFVLVATASPTKRTRSVASGGRGVPALTISSP